MRSNTKFKAVIFDLDGTLIDSLEDIANSANEVLASIGLPPHSTERYKTFIGDGVATLFKRALPAEQRNDEVVFRCVQKFREVYDRSWNLHTRSYPGIPELLAALDARGLELAVLSNKPDAFTKACVSTFCEGVPFRIVLGAREGIPHKPDPTSAIEIAKALEIQPEEIVYVGDTSVDMMTARNAGMYAVGVTWGFRGVDELRETGAQDLIDRPEELISVLDRHNSMSSQTLK